MARTRQTLVGSVSGQHVSLAVAAHLARTQLVPDPPKVHEGRHLTDMLDGVAQALARTAALHVTDAKTGETRQLTPAELEGAVVKRAATVLVLKDGRTLSGVSVQRADLRQAIAVLRAIGLHEIAPNLIPPPVPPPANAAPGDTKPDLLARLAEVEKLLQPPLLKAQVDRAKAAAVYIARHAPHGRVANLSMQLMSALHESRGTDDVPGGFRMALARLRAALDEASINSN
jgi:hypothetical protein